MAKQTSSKEHVEAVAQTIMSGFIPKDPEATSFSFHFTLPPDSHYQASYLLNEKREWQLSSVVPVERD
ncbi:hypothetical protein C7T94_04505 [Pedobacter yulinensis]|uniref:Uncharacterized protein n=1 Tax=Pedobacter yulinensis TaxID=2126353 RepID=A0A2T3HNH7_9SPHI|nr:hypothetical protein [Pedobacter yulinensis]PST84004.1 hypothetical protein C7T94_04505 [Pedobacter yulinensis]